MTDVTMSQEELAGLVAKLQQQAKEQITALMQMGATAGRFAQSSALATESKATGFTIPCKIRLGSGGSVRVDIQFQSEPTVDAILDAMNHLDRSGLAVDVWMPRNYDNRGGGGRYGR